MIKGRVFADSAEIRRINVNTAGYRELSHVHYLEKYEVTSILKYRELTGRVNSIIRNILLNLKLKNEICIRSIFNVIEQIYARKSVDYVE